VYIKRVELTHFKSFGGTTQVPLLPGFTVVSGPNGSGKSNILDALLFALGLSSSKGMRAERLPDLVNQNQASRGRSTVEASVTVTFDLGEAIDSQDQVSQDQVSQDSTEGKATEQNNIYEPQNSELEELGSADSTNLPALHEWTVTRKLRVTQQGTYTSNYFINDQSCTLTELHEQLHKLRIYPEGYNVVLQGDVTSIISMNPRERREIIDELAGVGAFDRKIHQAKDKLDAVKEREEKFRIVEKELITQRDRLAQDRLKAEKYQRLKLELQTKAQWEAVLLWRAQEQQVQQMQLQIEAGERTHAELNTQLIALNQVIQAAIAELEQLNAKVKALGEDELLAFQSTLATREAELRQVQRQEQDLATAQREIAVAIDQTQRDIQEQLQQQQRLSEESHSVETQELAQLRSARDQAKQSLEQQRESATTIAAASDVWVQEQAAVRQRMETLLQALEPQRTEQARLQERVEQLRQKIQEQSGSVQAIAEEVTTKQGQYTQIVGTLSESLQQVEVCQKALTVAEQELQIQQETQTRLIQEQRDKQRQLDKLEAQAQAIQETQGTGVIEVLQRAKLSGICGLVAQLGKVEPQYQLALEIAAGARLSYLVVEDDRVGADVQHSCPSTKFAPRTSARLRSGIALMALSTMPST
jgi:chromosome segregation protein